MPLVLLTQNQSAIIDDIDYDYTNQFSWSYCKEGYARRGTVECHYYLHVEIAKRAGIYIPSLLIDHKNLDKLDNVRSNLRAVTKLVSNLNRGLQSNNTSGYWGVYWNIKDQKWISQITRNKCTTYLGSFNNPIDAAIRYDIAAKRIFGKNAHLNFPEKENENEF